jgi:RNA polymerase sigma-70 factor (ECF subfamily)
MPGEPSPDSAERLEQFRDGIRLLALRSLGDPELAEEVAQETLARALVALRDGRRCGPPRSLQAYVRGIAHNVIAATIRDRSHTRRFLESYGPTQARPPGALEVLVAAERAERVRSALRQLSGADRQILRLCYYEDLPSREVARRLGQPGPRVRKRKSRAVARLRRVYCADDEGTEMRWS